LRGGWSQGRWPGDSVGDEEEEVKRRKVLMCAGEGMVPEEGVEPTRPCGHRILSPARLPVPPLRENL
jgi:hypothetical protein